MLKMASDAAAPAANSRRSAETSTSTLWAPKLPGLPSSTASTNPAPGTDAYIAQHQKRHICDHESLSVTARRAEAGLQQRECTASEAAEPSLDQTQEAAAQTDATTSRGNDEVSQPDEVCSASQTQGGQAQVQHHDATQPWAIAWTQAALPPVATASARTALPTSGPGPEPVRRATAADVCRADFLQQRRQISGLHAARSLSWSNSAGEDQTLPSQHVSGKPLLLQSLMASSILKCCRFLCVGMCSL